MPAKITELTSAQISRMPEWADKWVKIGLSTEPAHWAQAKQGAMNCYRVANLKQPDVVLYCGSPLSATLGGIMAVLSMSHKRGIKSPVWSQVRSPVWSQVRAKVGENVGAPVRAKVWENVGAPVRGQVGAPVGEQVWAKVEEQVRGKVGEQVWSQVRATVNDSIYQYRGCQLGSSWYSYISFLRDVCDWENDSLSAFAYDEQLALSCGWTWWHNDVVAISDRMSFISRDSRGRLHNENGPALAYPDGWCLYSVHGVSVPEYIVERPHEITAEKISKERNAEIRRVMIDKFGASRYLLESGAVEVARDGWGILYRAEMPGDEPLVMVRYANSTPDEHGNRKEYWRRVHPQLRPIFFVEEDGTQHLGDPQPLTPRNAIASSMGLYGGEYNPDIQT